MPDRLEPQIRRALEQLDAAAPAHELPRSAEVWSRLQFRLGYRPRRESFAVHAGPLLAAAYVLAFLIWVTRPSWPSTSLITVLAAAAAAALLLCARFRKTFRS